MNVSADAFGTIAVDEVSGASDGEGGNGAPATEVAALWARFHARWCRARRRMDVPLGR